MATSRTARTSRTAADTALPDRETLRAIVRMMVGLYIEADDAEAERMRAEYGVAGPRPAGAAERFVARQVRQSRQEADRRAPGVRELALA